MAAIVVNVPPYEGEYELDINAGSFSHFEWRVIKKVSGYLPLTWDEGWEGGDPDLFLSLALIAMVKAGRIEKRQVMDVAQVIEDAPVDGVAISVKVDEDVEEGEADPPQDSSDSPDGEKSPGGDDTSESSDASPESESPSTSGIRALDTTSTSDPLTLAK